MERKVLFAAILWSIGITVLSFIPMKKTDLIAINFEVNDKLVHFIFYFVLVLLWSFSQRITSKATILKVYFFALFYGTIIEVLQPRLSPSRSSDWFDILANFFGGTTAFLIVLIVKKSKN